MHISTNIRKLSNLFFLLFLALSGGMVYWQVAVANAVASNEHNSRRCVTTNMPVRGRIFDRNGVLLADSYNDPRSTCGPVRRYYEPSLAPLIGYYVRPDFASTGIEHQFDDILSGKSSATALNSSIDKLLHRSPIGNDIYLTIDARIQRLADQHFDDPTQNNETAHSNRGSIVISNPHTGEILAMVSRPKYDPSKLVQSLLFDSKQTYYKQLIADKDQPLLVRPLQGRYVPGSTFKTMTLLAGLDSGKTKLDEQFDQQHAFGPIVVNGQKIGPTGNNIEGYTFHFPVNTEYGFTHSDNIIFAQIGMHTGAEAWMDYNKRFYVEREIPFELPVAVSRVLPSGKDTLTENELAANAFGQGADFITPFQMSLIDNVVANNGHLMKPTVILKVTDHDKNTLQEFSAQPLSNPVSEQTATQVRQAMFGVARCGSGTVVRDLFTSKTGIVGKTGTAEIGPDVEPHGWMITQAPYSVNNPGQLPALTIVAMKENAGEGAFAVGPLIAHTYEDVFGKGFVNAQLPKPVDPDYCFRTGLLQR